MFVGNNALKLTFGSFPGRVPVPLLASLCLPPSYIFFSIAQKAAAGLCYNDKRKRGVYPRKKAYWKRLDTHL